MANIYFGVGLIIVQILTMMFHGFGLLLLTRLFIKRKADVQHVFVFFLSAVEILILVAFICQVIKYAFIDIPELLDRLSFKALVLVLSPCIFFNMFALVLNKVMEVALNIKYQLYINKKKAKYMELIVTLIFFIIFILAFFLEKENSNFVWPMYTRFAGDILFLPCFCISYGFIFHRYKQSRISPTQRRPSQGESFYVTFRNSRFFISVTLAITFILFTVLPDFLYVKRLLQEKEDEILLMARYVLYTFSGLSDAYIYIFLDIKVKREVPKIICFCNCRPNRSSRIGQMNIVSDRNDQNGIEY